MSTAGVSQGPARPLRRDAELNRQRLLEAAEEVFAERGLEASLDDVARRAGVGVGTAYRRFANKEELIDALFEKGIDETVALAQDALDDPDPWEGLVAFIERLTDVMASNRGLNEMMTGTSHGQRKAARARERMQPIGERIIERAHADGRLRADLTPQDVAVILVMLGAAADYCHPVRPDAWRRYLTFFIDGLRADRDEPTPPEVPPLSQGEVDAMVDGWRSQKR